MNKYPCISCLRRKPRNQFRSYECGDRVRRCFECEQNNEIKCLRCKVYKPSEEFGYSEKGKRFRKCNACKESGAAKDCRDGPEGYNWLTEDQKISQEYLLRRFVLQL